MKTARVIVICLLLTAIVAGTISDVPRRHRPLVLRGYRVLAADFHVHSFPLSWATLSPWDTVIDAQRHGLDVIAMTGHNHVWVAKAGRWFSRLVNGPTVLVGEEIVSSHYHLLAVGIDTTVSWRQTAASAIDAVHRQGGVAIAAHPLAHFWPAYDAEAIRKLDGAEVLHPIAYESEELATQLRQFYGRARLTAIGDSDYHGLGPMGLCRTYIFTPEETEQGILSAVREGRTVVYDRGRAYGDPALIRLAAEDGTLPKLALTSPVVGYLSVYSRVAGILSLIGAVILGCGAGERREQTP
jgi:predicted metal-dependent phosphoesterase TrpH